MTPIDRARELLAGVDHVAESVVRVPDGGESTVFGFDARHRDRVVAVVEATAPAHAARTARWLDALADATDVGVKVGERAGDVQVYARGRLPADPLVAAFAAAEVACAPQIVRNGFALFDEQVALMAGLELHDDVAGGAVYVGVPRARRTARALDQRIAFLATALVPAAPAVWRALAPVLLETAGEEIAYVSFAPVERGGWIKLDVGERPVSTARRVVEAAGLAAHWPPLAAQLERAAPERWSHIGVRLADAGCAVVLYHVIR